MYWLPYSSHTSHHPSQTPCFPWISYATQKLMLDSCKMVEEQSEAFHKFLWHFFPSLKHNFIAYCSFSRPDCIFEIHQLWQSGFCMVYSNSCCSCSFEPEIIKIGQSSHKMYSNNSEFSRVYDNFKCWYKKSLETYWMHHIRAYTLLHLNICSPVNWGCRICWLNLCRWLRPLSSSPAEQVSWIWH